MNKVIDQQAVTGVVREQYGAVASSMLSGEQAGVRAVARAFGYSEQELGSIPAGANMGLSCGNPTAMASLRPGEVVVDLGSGGGIDVFLASKQVGPTGKAIGVDMTPQMLERARKVAKDGGYANVEFREGSIDKLPLPDQSADCIISNCVINLAPDKQAVFDEMYRVLKPGGRVAVSDIAIRKELPADLARDVMAYVGCIAGAIPVGEYAAGLSRAGFEAVHVVDAKADLNAYANVEGQSACCSPPMTQLGGGSLAAAGGGCCGSGAARTVHGGLATVIGKYDVNEYAASVKVYAVKPG